MNFKPPGAVLAMIANDYLDAAVAAFFMNSGFDKFQELEDRIVRTIELVKTTRQERTNAEKELSAARSQIKTLEREIDQLRHERDLVKDKVESLLETLSALTEESVV